MLASRKDLNMELSENVNVSAKSVTAANAQMSQVMVKGLETPLGTLQNAIVRADHIASIDVSIVS